MVLVVLLLAVLGALALWGPGRSVVVDDRPATVEPSVVVMQELAEELAQIGDLFSKVIENSRDAQVLIDRVDAVLVKLPSLAEAHTLRGQMLMFAGRLDESLRAFDASLESEPRQPEVLMLTGTVAGKIGRYEDARHHFEQALSIEPSNGRYAISLASTQIKLGQDDDAVQTLLTAIRRDSELHGAYMTLSDIYGKQNKMGMALSQIERAIEKVPKDKPGLRVAYTLRRASLLRRNNQPGESLAALHGLPEEALYQPVVMRDIATSWVMLGKPAMAADHYEQALLRDPSNDLAAAEAARFRIKVGDIDVARKHIQTLRRINPRSEALNDLDKALEGG